LLKLHNWARIVLIVFSALGVLSAPLGIMSLQHHLQPLMMLRFPVGLAINIWILIYLFRPRVKEAFGATGF
jgi:hypothetical protein